MLSTYLWIAGSLPFIVLGTIHLVYTFFTNKFSSFDKTVEEGMKKTNPLVTRDTTMWKAWTGFNASHSAGAIYIGLFNFILGVRYPHLLSDPVLISLNLLTVLFYLWLAKKYWFRIPLVGLLLAAVCFLIATMLVVSR